MVTVDIVALCVVILVSLAFSTVYYFSDGIECVMVGLILRAAEIASILALYNHWK